MFRFLSSRRQIGMTQPGKRGKIVSVRVYPLTKARVLLYNRLWRSSSASAPLHQLSYISRARPRRRAVAFAEKPCTVVSGARPPLSLPRHNLTTFRFTRFCRFVAPAPAHSCSASRLYDPCVFRKLASEPCHALPDREAVSGLCRQPQYRLESIAYMD